MLFMTGRHLFLANFFQFFGYVSYATLIFAERSIFSTRDQL
jgi:hypothetical protein